MSAVTCPNCQSELPSATRFCPQCGQRMPEPPAPQPAPTVVLPPAPQPAPTVVLPPAAPSQAPAPQAPPLPSTEQRPPAETPTVIAGPPADAPAGGGGKRLWWILGVGGCLSLILVAACALTLVMALARMAPATSATALPAATPEGGVGGSVPGDAPLTEGDLLLRDDFDDPVASGLGEEEDESLRYAYEDGAYVIEVKEPETIVWARVEGSYTDIAIEVDAETPPGAEIAAAGVIFHYQDADNFYLFSVSNDRFYTLEILLDNEWTTLVDWTESDLINEDRNRLRIETRGDQIALFVNGELLETTVDGTFTEGEVGLAVSSFDQGGGLVRFDNLEITRNE
ncbi:MAG: hypothetical protein OHK0015_16350 [Chloroflexi bacterium OHK40]